MDKNIKPDQKEIFRPDILAPAGSRASFMAALAAGADAIYCGLKRFSARMEAKNFPHSELASLTDLAHAQGTKVYIAFNTMLKPGDLERAGKSIAMLSHHIEPDAIIIQDLAMIDLARQAGFKGEIHLSTLSNVTFPAAMKLVKSSLGVDRVVIPRELNIDEMKEMAAACPPGLDLEAFIHGALCYGVSGRCYWSSFLGGRSGLRGRCVQPCRRHYDHEKNKNRYFSCQDLSMDVLAKVLRNVPQIKAWKIEGRKKGPHYVYYTVSAYRMMRDHGNDPAEKKNAIGLLERALGRPSTHYNFLPQRPQNPVRTDIQTGSGLLIGRVKGSAKQSFLVPREELLPGDVLRIGYEDDAFHTIVRINKSVPRKGNFHIKTGSKKGMGQGAPVFLTDRREKALADMIAGFEEKFVEKPEISEGSNVFKVRYPKKVKKKIKIDEVSVYRMLHKITGVKNRTIGCWLGGDTTKGITTRQIEKIWWWLPPVIWPENQDETIRQVEKTVKNGGRKFVLNAPWQTALFSKKESMEFWAGPFCNAANALMIDGLKKLGFSGAIVSTELGEDDYMKLPEHSSLPLGIVVYGNWPLCISRVLAENLKEGEPFTSPMGEQGWAKKYNHNYWVYPNWKVDIRKKQESLVRAGYRRFIHLFEPVPKTVTLKKRPGLWNWEHGLR
ncbi:MAG: U32 family peptidase [Desulfobacterales bacterium]|nr:U32 family peptidase [Desulfobacterales bacterium]